MESDKEITLTKGPCWSSCYISTLKNQVREE